MREEHIHRPAGREPISQIERPRPRHLGRSGALAGAITAASTTVIAASASAADVPLEVNGETIPIAAFAWWTLVGAALGVVFARLLRQRRRFVIFTTVAACLSLVPAIAAPDHTATKIVLAGAHLCAAAIVIPALSRALPVVDPDHESSGPT